LHAYLRRADLKGIALGGLSLGTWILARAGLLNKAACTIHWEALPAFCEAYPEITVTNDLFVINSNRYTASGGLAGMEIMLEIIRTDHGDAVVQKIANVYQLDRIRTASARQRPGAIKRLDTLPGIIQQTVGIMQETIERPVSISQIAKELETSVRNLERAFMRHLGTSPAKYYLSLRLEKARELLMHTNHQTLDIALQCGFSSGSYFARCFQREFRMRPSDQRKKAS
jgi:transcriptional regulator GlxA family with amidase domain